MRSVIVAILLLTGCSSLSRGQRAVIGGGVAAVGTYVLVDAFRDNCPEGFDGIGCVASKDPEKVIGTLLIFAGAVYAMVALTQSDEPDPDAAPAGKGTQGTSAPASMVGFFGAGACSGTTSGFGAVSSPSVSAKPSVTF
jgi:hypothetical protein